MAERTMRQKVDGSTADLHGHLHYDPEAGVFTRMVGGRGGRIGAQAGCVDNSTGYVRIHINGRLYYAHRLAWLYTHGRWPVEHVDHVNGVRADNRLCNLREATRTQNNRNSGLSIRNTSGERGVDYHKGRWRARVYMAGKTICLGEFADLDEAIAARRAAVRFYHGEFARTA